MSRPFSISSALAACAAVALLLPFAAPAGAAEPPSALGPEAPVSKIPESGFVGHVSVAPTHGAVGTPVTVKADGLSAGAEVQLVWRTVKGSWKVDNAQYNGRDFQSVAYQIAKVKVGADGTASAEFVAPEDFGFSHDVVVQQGATELTQTGFYIDMSVDVSPKRAPQGTPLTVDVKGIGWRSLHNSWQLLYDNRYTGWISSVTTGGSAHFTIPAAGAAGAHVVEVIHGGFTFAYRNMQQSPEPDRPQFATTVTITNGDPVLPPSPEAQAQTEIRRLPTPGDLAVTPAFAPVGAPIAVTGDGFTPGETYKLNWTTVTGNRVSGGGWEESSRAVASAAADSAGRLEFNLAAPDDLGGIHQFWVADGDARKSGSLLNSGDCETARDRRGTGRHALHHTPQGRGLDRDRQHLHDRLRQLLCGLCLRLQQPGRRGDPSDRHRRSGTALHRPAPGNLQGQGERTGQFPAAAAHLPGRPSRRRPSTLPLRLQSDGADRMKAGPAAPRAAGRHLETPVGRQSARISKKRGFSMSPLRTASNHARCAALAAAAAVALTLGGLASGPATAATKLTVGNPKSDSFSFVPLTIGKELGIFAKHGIDLEVKTFAGTDELEAALANGTVGIALGSGTEFAFIPNGAPDTAVATLAVRPALLVVSVRPDTAINAAADLKGQAVGVDAGDPLPAWLVKTLSEDQGWGPDGIKAVPLSALLASDGKINSTVDGIVADLPMAVDLQNSGNGRTVVNFGDVVKNFPFYVAFARNDLIKNDQDTVKNFLTAWFETVKWMNDNKEAAIDKAAAATGDSKATTAALYGALMPAYSPDGKFDQKALDQLAKALVEMKVLDRQQDLGRYVKQDILGSSCDNR